jgi:general secretion pathway protein G
MSRINYRSGFTLIELLLVLVILAILAAVVVPKFAKRGEQAREAAAKTDISNMETALDAYEIDTGRYPTTEEGLAALFEAPSSAKNWKGPYLKKGVPNDPWGNPYQYANPGTHAQNGFDLYSYGPTGSEGEGNIDNWTVNTGN